MFKFTLALTGFIATTVFAHGAFAAPLSCSDPNFDAKLLARNRPGPIPKFKHVDPETRPLPTRNKIAKIPVNGHELKIKYDHYAASVQPARSTIIYHCGGPGVACTVDGPGERLPNDADIIVYDYIGTGANKGNKPDPEFLSVESQGAVTAGLVRSLKLDNYVLYGSSFGTTVATIAASELSKDPSVAKPKSVVLEGVVGLAAESDYSAAFTRVFERAWELLNDHERQLWPKIMKHFEKKIPERELVSLIDELREMATLGPREVKKMLSDIIAGMDGLPPTKAEIARARRERARQPKPEPADSGSQVASNPENHRQYRAAGCQLSPVASRPDPKGFVLGNTISFQNPNEMSLSERLSDSCRCPLIKRLYDPANFVIENVPVIYLSGGMDMLTPLDQLRHHDAVQTRSPKVSLISLDDGHGALQSGVMQNCSDLVWDAAIKADLASLERNRSRIEKGNCPSRSANESSGPTRQAR